MAKVEWIRIDVDIFQNPKLKRIRREEHGNEKMLLWIMMLTTAGRCNERGLLKMGDGLPYEIDDFADAYHIDKEIIADAIVSFKRYGLVEELDGCYSLPGWEEHQNTEGLEKIREQNRERKRLERERKRLSQTVTCDSHVTVTQCHATEEEREEEKEEPILYPIIAASKHGQRAMRTLSISGLTKEALEEADMSEELKEFT